MDRKARKVPVYKIASDRRADSGKPDRVPTKLLDLLVDTVVFVIGGFMGMGLLFWWYPFSGAPGYAISFVVGGMLALGGKWTETLRHGFWWGRRR
jgi:hypothetical protein